MIEYFKQDVQGYNDFCNNYPQFTDKFTISCDDLNGMVIFVYKYGKYLQCNYDNYLEIVKSLDGIDHLGIVLGNNSFYVGHWNDNMLDFIDSHMHPNPCKYNYLLKLPYLFNEDGESVNMKILHAVFGMGMYDENYTEPTFFTKELITYKDCTMYIGAQHVFVVNNSNPPQTLEDLINSDYDMIPAMYNDVGMSKSAILIYYNLFDF